MIWLTWRQFRAQARGRRRRAVAVAAAVPRLTPRARGLPARPATTFLDGVQVRAPGGRRLHRRRRGGAVRAGDRRRLLGRAAGRPRARGRHAPARVERSRVTRTRWLATKLARHRRSPRWPRSGCSSLILTWWSGLARRRDQRRADRERAARRRADRAADVRGARHRADRLHRVRARPGRRARDRRAPHRARDGDHARASSSPCRSSMPLFVRAHLGARRRRPARSRPENLDGLMAGSARGTRRARLRSPSTSKPGAWLIANQTIDRNGQVAQRAPVVGHAAASRGHVRRSRRPAAPTRRCFKRARGEGYRQRVTLHAREPLLDAAGDRDRDLPRPRRGAGRLLLLVECRRLRTPNVGAGRPHRPAGAPVSPSRWSRSGPARTRSGGSRWRRRSTCRAAPRPG